MIKNQKSYISYYQFEIFNTFQELTHFISTRLGGHSKSPFAQLNLSYKNDEKSVVLQNRALLAKTLDISQHALYFAQQSHSNKVFTIHPGYVHNSPQTSEIVLPEADALITQEKGRCLCVTSADCVPLLFFDPTKKAIGAAHSGWRGTVGKIATKLIEQMVLQFDSSPKDLRVGIGPCIGVNRYEIGDDVVKAVQNSYGDSDAKELLPFNTNTNKYHFDLIKANLLQLKSFDITDNQIEVANICTYDNSTEFFSYRKQQGKVGVFGTGIMLK